MKNIDFSGWSSRIEIHEQFAEVQDEKLEELTDSLVSCMTGPEGQGGDDQVKIFKTILHFFQLFVDPKFSVSNECFTNSIVKLLRVRTCKL